MHRDPLVVCVRSRGQPPRKTSDQHMIIDRPVVGEGIHHEGKMGPRTEIPTKALTSPAERHHRDHDTADRLHDTTDHLEIEVRIAMKEEGDCNLTLDIAVRLATPRPE